MNMQTTVAWTEIPVSNIDKAVTFYNAALGWQMTTDTTGPMPMAVFKGGEETVGGHLFEGVPAQDGGGPRVHIAVETKLEDAAKRWENAGGKVICDPVTIPVGRFVYATDPDGNTLGLFEHKD